MLVVNVEDLPALKRRSQLMRAGVLDEYGEIVEGVLERTRAEGDADGE